jgi:hypothetical protein
MATDDPESGVSLTPKQAYRLQLKLRAALAEVVRIMVLFANAKLRVNWKNLAMAAGVADLLVAQLGITKDLVPRQEDFDPLVLNLAVEQLKRRRQQTRKRSKRRTRIQERPDEDREIAEIRAECKRLGLPFDY